jgi:hypothetical protein
MLEYQIIADGNIVAATAGSPSTILTTLSAYDSTFHDLWSNCVMVHDDMIWTLPLPWTFFPLMSPPPSAALPPAPASTVRQPQSCYLVERYYSRKVEAILVKAV